MEIRAIEVHLRADIHELPRLFEKLGQFAAACAVPDGAMFKVELALDELINNVIDHGYANRASGDISVRVTHDGDNLHIELSDDAALFDPFSIAAPGIDAQVEDRPLGGLGVHLVRTLMSSAGYSVRNGRNHVRLRLGLRDKT